MYFDLFLPFPLPISADYNPKGKNKGKGKAVPQPTVSPTSCWSGIEPEDKEAFAKRVALAGHLGYNVVAPTVVREAEGQAYPSPFATLPFPSLDPRHTTESSDSQAGPSRSPVLVQVTRYHVRLDDAKTNPITTSNTNTLRHYDILSCQPTNDKALQLACTDLANPGPNQISIITLPLHERPYHFRLNRKQIKQAQRNGVVLEILYSAGLFPPASTSADTVRRYRQNWMSNAREIVRITGGKGVILSSGPGGGPASLRGPADLINLATTLGMPANVAKNCVALNGKMVLLRAQARRTFKAVMSTPQLIPPPGGAVEQPPTVPAVAPIVDEPVLPGADHKDGVPADSVAVNGSAGSAATTPQTLVGVKRGAEARVDGKPGKRVKGQRTTGTVS